MSDENTSSVRTQVRIQGYTKTTWYSQDITTSTNQQVINVQYHWISRMKGFSLSFRNPFLVFHSCIPFLPWGCTMWIGFLLYWLCVIWICWSIYFRNLPRTLELIYLNRRKSLFLGKYRLSDLPVSIVPITYLPPDIHPRKPTTLGLLHRFDCHRLTVWFVLWDDTFIFMTRLVIRSSKDAETSKHSSNRVSLDLLVFRGLILFVCKLIWKKWSSRDVTIRTVVTVSCHQQVHWVTYVCRSEGVVLLFLLKV